MTAARLPAAATQTSQAEESAIADRHLADVLVEHVTALRPNMIQGSAYSFADNAAAAYLLDRILGPGRWHSILVNSDTEAVGVVTKFLRNLHNRRRPTRVCRILVFDASGTVASTFGGPTRTSGHRRDGVTVVGEVGRFIDVLESPHDAVVVVTDGTVVQDLHRIESALQVAHPAPCAWGALRDSAAARQLLAEVPRADVVFLGEALTDNAYPAGSISFAHNVFAEWDNAVDSVAHVSTFGGNALACRLAVEVLLRHPAVTVDDRAEVDRIRRDRVRCRARLRMHGNTWQARSIDMAGFDLDVREATGARYRTVDRELVDLTSGSGPAYLGHNALSANIIHDALLGSKPRRSLEEALAALTGLPILLPAVSGSTAVDFAISAALCARPDRSVVVTVRGNFSGKGPLSLALSRTSRHFRDLDEDAFRPYAVDVIEVDVDDRDALVATLRRSDVALVWLEPVQGLDCVPVPAHVFETVDRYRAEYGYLVGYDEVITAFWRANSGSFLAAPTQKCVPDVVALSKALSGGLVPIGAALVSADVFARMTEVAPEQSRWLREHYANSASQALALASIQRAIDTRDEVNRARVEAALEQMLSSALTSAVFSTYRCRGLHARLVVAPLLGRHLSGRVEDLVEAVVGRMVLRHCDAVLMQLRVLPCIATPDVDIVVDSLQRVGGYLSQLRWGSVVLHALRMMLKAGSIEVAMTFRVRRLAR